MFQVYLTNFRDLKEATYASVEEAVEAGRKFGFEFAVVEGLRVIAAWSPIGGLRYL